jgi:F0F1-type ATP synthase membrane subunit a
MTTGDSTILLHYLPFGVLFILTFLELGVAMIQAYIFVLLGYIYLRDVFAGH